MSKYVVDIALYGLAIFTAGVAWEITSALIKRHKNPPLPFSGASYDSRHEKPQYEVAHRA